MSKSRQGITPTFSKGKRDTSSVQQTDPKRARTLMIITFPDCIVLTKSTRKNSTMNNTKGACENVVGIVYCVEHVFSEKLPIRPIGPSLHLQRLCEKQVPQRPTKNQYRDWHHSDVLLVPRHLSS
ncbi:hypothetical protein OUZ56_008307 [Daphnia magna]|uniref:Uncharacterized protein n=1 Tax=Daphnia magna TaxID=35525 RepID=A0ABR0ACL0_9CRUS|nr:hypothetical protein OUZ56_008307 [Daphnia magna]